MAWTPVQRYVAEFVGTFGLLVAITGPALLTLGLPQVVGTVRFLMIAVGAGFGLAAVILAFGELSGGHFNPAVTVGAWAAGRFPARDVVPYVLAQVAGAVVGVGTIAAVAYGNAHVWSQAIGVSLGSEGYSGGSSPYAFGLASVFLLEVVLTFLFVSVILLATRPERSAKNLAPLGIGITLLMAHLASLTVDGTSLNPARSFAPALLSAYWSADRWAIAQDWLFWVAPIVGALLAAAVDRFLAPKA